MTALIRSFGNRAMRYKRYSCETPSLGIKQIRDPVVETRRYASGRQERIGRAVTSGWHRREIAWTATTSECHRLTALPLTADIGLMVKVTANTGVRSAMPLRIAPTFRLPSGSQFLESSWSITPSSLKYSKGGRSTGHHAKVFHGNIMLNSMNSTKVQP